MSNSVSRVKRLWLWLIEARYAWLALGVIAFALIVYLRPQTPEPVIRLTGLVLQLLGIGTVIWGISKTRALFGHPSFSVKVKSWFERFPLRRKSPVQATVAAILSDATLNARGYVMQGPGPNSTVETRLNALEENISSIHERISSIERVMGEEFRKKAEAIRNEEQARKTEDNAIRAKLEATGTGGVHISAIGALWLFVGVILSSASVEIAELLK